MKVVVIGGGASGLVASIYASRKNEVILLEKNSNCGKKLLITGSGKCNYWNSDFTSEHYRSNNKDILNNIINKSNQEEILKFFDSIGIYPKIKNGYYYPYSNQAVSVQNALLLEAKKVEIKNNTVVKDISYNGKFIITTNSGIIEADKVILGVGSKACPKTGSDGFGYDILKKFNHTIIEPLPALVQLKSNASFLKKWAGIRTDVEVSLYENNKLIGKSTGEATLTDYGISGICIMQLSGLVSRGLYNGFKEKLLIDFMPCIKVNDINEFKEWIDKRNNKLSKRNLVELFEGILNYKLLFVILKQIGMSENNYWNELSDSEKLKLAKALKEFLLDITGTNTFDHAQVCTGGIPLNEVNENMESIKQKGLYIIGELLDADGDCGGYNLGFAFITGMLAGRDND